MTRRLRTYSRINDDTFTVTALMLWGWLALALLPFLILFNPVRSAWNRKQGRAAWRIGACAWLVVSLLAGVYCTYMTPHTLGALELVGFPFRRANIMNAEQICFGLINLFVVTGTMMLGLQVALLADARTRRRVA